MENLVTSTKDLMQGQAKANDEQTLALLPSLTIDDLNPDLQFFHAMPDVVQERPLIISELDTNSISYIDFGFNCTGLAPEDLMYLDLFGTIVTEIGTEDSDYKAFAKQINICTGGFSHTFSTYQQKKQPDTLQPILWFQVKALSVYFDNALNLVQKVLTEVSFHDRERIRDIVQREFAWAEHSVQSEGYSLASARVFSHLSVAGQYNEQVSGVTAYLALKTLATEYEEKEEQFLQTLAKLKKELLVRNRIISAITSRHKEVLRLKEQLPSFIQAFPMGGNEHNPTSFPKHPLKEAFCTSAEVVYNIQGCNLFSDPDTYNGQFEVLKTWLSRDYLWNTVRQVGGAYGCFIQFNQRTGNLAMISYRDPQIVKTFATYDDTWKQVEHLDLSQPVLQQLVIGTYGNFDPHQGPAGLGITARNEYLAGITSAFKQQRVEEILATTVEDLRFFTPYLKNIAENKFTATIGNSSKIKGNSAIFDNIVDL